MHAEERRKERKNKGTIDQSDCKADVCYLFDSMYSGTAARSAGAELQGAHFNGRGVAMEAWALQGTMYYVAVAVQRSQQALAWRLGPAIRKLEEQQSTTRLAAAARAAAQAGHRPERRAGPTAHLEGGPCAQRRRRSWLLTLRRCQNLHHQPPPDRRRHRR